MDQSFDKNCRILATALIKTKNSLKLLKWTKKLFGLSMSRGNMISLVADLVKPLVLYGLSSKEPIS